MGERGGSHTHAHIVCLFYTNLHTHTFCYYDNNRLTLELKTLADVGLVGLPNAGKSTFLTAVSNAHPRIAPYPFTTLNPHLGVVDFADYWRMRVADIPGIIPGAHRNRGLGHSFLRHIERNKVLLYIVDARFAASSHSVCMCMTETETERETGRQGERERRGRR